MEQNYNQPQTGFPQWQQPTQPQPEVYQPPPQYYQEAPLPASPAPGKGNPIVGFFKLILVIILLILFFLAGYSLAVIKGNILQLPLPQLFLGGQTVSTIVPTPLPEFFNSPTATVSAAPTTTPVATTSGRQLLYAKNGNIFNYSFNTNQEQQLTNDTGNFIYRLPRWARSANISFVKCDKKTDPKAQYKCIIVEQQLNGVTPVEHVSLTSQPNSTGTQFGGTVNDFAWDPARTHLSYSAYVAKSATVSAIQVHILSMVDKTDVLLGELNLTAGRGGSPDDHRSIAFSPDGKKLLYNDTNVYPPLNTAADQGTLFIYDTETKKSLFSLPKTWLTFAGWLNTTTVVAKQAANFDGKGKASWSLVRIDSTKTAVKDMVEKIADAPNWYGITPFNQTQVLFWLINKTKSSGITLSSLNLTTKAAGTVLKENLLPLKVIDEKTLLVNTLRKCAKDECGLDFYNGVVEDKVTQLDLVSGKTTPLNLASSSGYLTDIDVK